jgi:ribosome recycling factor
MVFDFQRDSNDLKIKIISFLNEKYNLLHVDRANPDLIENIKVSVYGLEQDIKNISKVSVIDNITLKINPFDKNTTSNIVSSITNNEL